MEGIDHYFKNKILLFQSKFSIRKVNIILLDPNMRKIVVRNKIFNNKNFVSIIILNNIDT